MRIILQKKLVDFTKKHSDAESSVTTWRKVVQKVTWKRALMF